MPAEPPVDEQTAEYQRMIEEAEKQGKKDMRGIRGSLKEALKGMLPTKEVLDISPDKSLKSLIATKGRKPTPLSTLVANGTLDDFLPYDMRLGSPTFDELQSVGYIYDKLASGNFGTFEAELVRQKNSERIRAIEEAMREHLDMEETN